MEYNDEKIRQMKRAARQRQAVDLSAPIIVGEETYNFKRTRLFENKVSTLLPTEFVDMPTDIAKLKYPMEQRPQVIKTNLATDVNFAFSLLPQSIKNEEVSEAVVSFRKLIKRMQPGNRFFDQKIEQAGDLTLGWFDFRSPGIDDQLYTMMAVAGIDNMLFYSIFNCAYSVMQDWKSVAREVFKSVEDETKK